MYKKILLIVSFCMFLLQAGAAEADYNVIPQPQQVTLTKDNLLTYHQITDYLSFNRRVDAEECAIPL